MKFLGNQFTFIIIFVFQLSAQPLVKQWDYSLGGYDSDFLSQLIAMPDGGFVACGISFSDAGYDKSTNNWNSGTYTYDWWLIKCDANGIKQWDINLGGSESDYFYSGTATSDGGLIVTGSINSDNNGNISQPTNGGPDMWVVKLSVAGSIQWGKKIRGTEVDAGSSVMEVSGGGYAGGGHTNSPQGLDVSDSPFGTFDYWMVRLDASGNKLWDKRYGGSESESVSQILPAPDNGFMLAGSSISPISGLKTKDNYVSGKSDAWFVRTDASGNKIADYVRGSLEDDIGIHALYTMDNHYLMSATNFANIGTDKSENGYGVNDFWLLKLDTAFNVVWDHSIGGWDNEGDGSNITELQDGGYLISGTAYSPPNFWKTDVNNGPECTWVVKVDAQGNKVWDKTLLTDYAHEEYGTAVQLADGCIVIGNDGDSFIGGEKTDQTYNFDYWCIKFCDMSAPLPVELLRFEGNEIADKIEVKWETASETNNSFFELQRKTAGENFETISHHNGYGTTSSFHLYSYDDYNIKLGMTYYYQLKQTDFNGGTHYSKVIAVKTKKEDFSFSIFPNPYDESTTIVYSLKESTHVLMEVFNAGGQKIITLENDLFTPGIYTTELNAKAPNYSKGVYTLRIVTNDEVITSRLMQTE